MNQQSVAIRARKNFTDEESVWTFRTDDLVALADNDIEQGWFHFLMYHAFELGPRLLRVRLRGFP